MPPLICPRFLGYLKPTCKKSWGANGVQDVMNERAYFPTGDEAEYSLLQAKMSKVGRLLQSASSQTGSAGSMPYLSHFVKRYNSCLTTTHQFAFQQLLESGNN